jgi:hypothetical protein
MRLWVQGSDVYLGARSLAGDQSFSFDESGQ